MYNEELEELIDAALADGTLTEKEKGILFRKADSMGIDRDELEMVLDSRLAKLKTVAPESHHESEEKEIPSNIAVNRSSVELEKRLKKEILGSGRATVITNFPVPNTKEDLLEFITAMMPRCKPGKASLFNRISGEDRPKEIADAYKKKVEECTAKAKVLFPGDPQFATLFQLYEEQAKKEKKSKYTKRIIVLLIIIALVVFVMSR